MNESECLWLFTASRNIPAISISGTPETGFSHTTHVGDRLHAFSHDVYVCSLIVSWLKDKQEKRKKNHPLWVVSWFLHVSNVTLIIHKSKYKQSEVERTWWVIHIGLLHIQEVALLLISMPSPVIQQSKTHPAEIYTWCMKCWTNVYTCVKGSWDKAQPLNTPFLRIWRRRSTGDCVQFRYNDNTPWYDPWHSLLWPLPVVTLDCVLRSLIVCCAIDCLLRHLAVCCGSQLFAQNFGCLLEPCGDRNVFYLQFFF